MTCSNFYCVLKQQCIVGHYCAQGTNYECPNNCCRQCSNEDDEEECSTGEFY